MTDQKKVKKKSLGKRLLLSSIIMALLISTFSCVSGYLQYNKTIRRLYNENGYVIGRMILNEIDHEEIAHLAETLKPDLYYYSLVDYLIATGESTGAAYIYIAVPNEDQTMTYICDNTGGVIGGSDPISAHFDDVYHTYTTGEMVDNYYVRHSRKYGYLTSCILPVNDSTGKTVALLFVDVHMELIESTLWAYVINAVLISLILITLFCIVYWLFMKKYVVKPIGIITQDLQHFAENETEISGMLDEINSRDEMEDLAAFISRMEHAIVDYIDNLQKVTAEKERIGAELNVATQIQADMLPRIFPPYPDRKEFDIYASMQPAKEVGGDFYDFFLVDDDHIVLVMADVSGKGVPAALFMVIAKTLIKNRAQTGGDLSPANILRDVNDTLCEGNEAALFVTVWLGVFTISTGKGMSANAGHEYPVLRHRDGSFEIVKDAHSVPVATMEGMKFKEQEFDLTPGDTLFVYTDGVAEATDASDTLFGTDRMLDALNKDADASVEDLLKNVKDSVDGFVKEAPQFDDLTMLAFKYHGPLGS